MRVGCVRVFFSFALLGAGVSPNRWTAGIRDLPRSVVRLHVPLRFRVLGVRFARGDLATNRSPIQAPGPGKSVGENRENGCRLIHLGQHKPTSSLHMLVELQHHHVALGLARGPKEATNPGPTRILFACIFRVFSDLCCRKVAAFRGPTSRNPGISGTLIRAGPGNEPASCDRGASRKAGGTGSLLNPRPSRAM